MSTKENILKILEENRGSYISGQAIGDLLSISRTAIWKGINELKNDGYLINSVTNKGYTLDAINDIISTASILPFLNDQYKNNQIVVLDSVTSTNTVAKELALKGAANGTIVIANEQTVGKGRMGRSFFSPKSSGIYLSIIIKPKFTLDDAMRLTTAASLCVCLAIEKTLNLKPQIKWVNDVYLDGKKICGILTEATTNFENGAIENITLGIGINFSTPMDAFPEEIKDNVTSLCLDKKISRSELIGSLLNELFPMIENLATISFIEEYKKRSFVLGKRINIIEQNIQTPCTALDITEGGGLVVELDDKTIKTLISGEISVRLLD